MTKRHVNRTLHIVFWSLGLVLAVAFASKMTRYLTSDERAIAIAGDVYLYLKEMAPVFITVIAAYLTSIFRKRSNFIESLEEEWRSIVAAKAALYAYFDKPFPATDDYIAAFTRISMTIDTMRIVYRNVGETKELVGLYPYAPLHDMRRVLQSMDPRVRPDATPADRKLAQDAIQQCFFALRENFLEELDLEEPHHPLLISAGRRLKRPGFTGRAGKRQDRQRAKQDKTPVTNPAVDAYLWQLYEAEHAGPAPPVSLFPDVEDAQRG